MSERGMTMVEQDEDTKWLAWIKNKFEGMAGEDGQIDLAEFKDATKAKEPFFVERIFALLDSDGGGTIDLEELMEGMTRLTKGDQMDKLRFLFDIFDVDGSGTIDPEELKTVLRSCMNESSMKLSEESLQELTMALFESADADGSGEITFEELVGELSKHPGVMDNLTISTSHWLRPPEENKAKKKPGWTRYFSKRYLQNNTRKVVFLLVYFLINIGLFIFSAWRYRKSNVAVIIARGCGMDLNFNCSFIVVLMLRRFLSWLRTTAVGNYLPMDQSILIHKLVGFVTTYQVIAHTVAHLVNIHLVLDVPSSSDAASINSTLPTHPPLPTYWEWLFTLQSGIGYIGPGFAYLSGVVLDVILFTMVLCSLGFIRRGGHFKIWVHIRSAGHWTGKVYDLFESVEEVSEFDDIEKGRDFINKGYVAENGHPGTAGTYVQNAKNGSANGATNTPAPKQRKESNDDCAKNVRVEVFVDGPYGTSSREIFDSDHAVLIASGIGVTPYASILQSIMHRYTTSKLTCPHCENHWYCDKIDRKMKLKQVDFIWINRNQNSFEWFVRLLAQLEMQQLEAGSEDFLQMQMYMTSAMAKNDVKGLGLQMAIEILHKKDNKDVMTGLRTRTQAGRPDWPQVFSKIADANKGRVKVFFCGAPALAKSIEGHCEKVGFSFSKENF